MHQTGYISKGGASIYYAIDGNRDGKPLILLHGGLSSGQDLHPLHDFTASDYSLISIDLRGHGKSSLGNTPLSYALYEDDVKTVLSHLAIDHYSIFGFSDGGIVAYRLAASQPEKIRCLITLGSQWRLQPDDPSIEVLGGLTPEFWAENYSDSINHYNVSNPAPDFSKLVQTVKKVWLDMSDAGYPNKEVSKITCPTLIMRGDDDFLLSLEEAVALKKAIQGAAFANIPFAMHAAHHESTNIVGKLLKRFLDEHSC